MRTRRAWTPGRGYSYLLIPPGIFLLLLFVWPLATVVYQGLFQPVFGFGNYATILASTTHLRVLLYTFELAAEVTLICLVISYPVAYTMSRAGDNMLHVSLAIVLIPFWTSVVIRTYAWSALFQRHGLVNDLLIQAGIVDEPVKFIYSNTGVLIGMVQILLPFMILPLLNAMRRMDITLLRAAEVLGANPLRVLLHVYIPLSMPGVTAGVLLVFISAIGFYVTPAVLGGPQQMMIAVLIEQYITRTLNWPLASALATILLLATTVLYLIYERATRRLGSAFGMGGG
jgi:putative spermidine/putrescine transport system permease protein/mannopine transport system permease protein